MNRRMVADVKIFDIYVDVVANETTEAHSDISATWPQYHVLSKRNSVRTMDLRRRVAYFRKLTHPKPS
jgi:hypothetical protein